MAAILQRKPLTIKQQVEELRNWHKQQQSKLDPKTVYKEHSSIRSYENENKLINGPNEPNSVPRVNFDELPIKVTNSNFNTLVENNVAPVDSHPSEKGRPGEKGNKPKFRFLKKGEGIARFNMGPPKVTKKPFSRRQGVSLKLTKDPNKSDTLYKDKEGIKEEKSVNLEKEGEIPTLQVPDVKLNFKTWKSILSGENPEDMLEVAISNNQLELWDPNSSIDSSTVSLMEKLLAIGKNKLSRDREELRVFETIEQHLLDSSFCSTSSYVNRLMENAVISTPNKETFHNQLLQATTSKNTDQVPIKQIKEGGEGIYQQGAGAQIMPKPSSMHFSVDPSYEKVIKIITSENKLESDQNNMKNNSEQKAPQPVVTWTKPETTRNQDYVPTVENSVRDLEQSLHVRFADQVDYKSFVELSQSVNNVNQTEGNLDDKFDESQEWKEDSEDSSSCCSQCSNHGSITEDVRPSNTQETQNHSSQCNSQSEENIPSERLYVSDLKGNNFLANNDPPSNDALNNIPPVLIEKLRELEDEIKIFREENISIKSLRENLEKERRQVQEEKRRLQLEKKKLQKEVEDERKKLFTQLETEKQKLAKERIVFEKYSKSLTKNPTREDRKEIEALRDQLSEMKEELNKKESRWGAAQARVRNQVKVLEEDNRKLREEVENLRKQTKYWELFNQKKKGKPFNNTRLIHAISEHISNIVLEDENSQEKKSESDGYLNQNSSASKTSSITHSDVKSMYGIKVIKENKTQNTLPSSKSTSKPVPNLEKVPSKIAPSDVGTENVNEINNLLSEYETPGIPTDFTVRSSSNAAFDKRNLQSQDRCQKPCLEDSSNIIKEVVDENGNMEIVFPNGNIKKINKITGSEKYIYINGDVEEVTRDGTVKYYYSQSRIWQTTLPDGLEIIDFPDGKVEKRHVDGTIEIIYSNNNKKFSYPDGSQEIIYTDGTRLKTEADESQILVLPNGQKEIHTKEWKRREYPDGTMKTLYPDGTTETVYSNGRVRLKDKYGNLVMDSDSPPST